jgi:lysozyme
MRTSARGRALIKHFEGVIPHAYNDPAGHCTVGVGHLIHHGPCSSADFARWGVRHRRKLSDRQIDELLADDLRPRERAVERLVRVRLRQHEFDALVSLLFNIGEGNFASSTVLRELNRGHRFRAGLAFLMWVKAGGQTLAGLVRRRRAERRLFRKGNWR